VRPEDYEHFVRIGADGHVRESHGSAARLASLSVYSCNLADAVGQLLDIGPASVVEATFAGGRLLTLREADGSIVGLKPNAPVPAPAAKSAHAPHAPHAPHAQGTAGYAQPAVAAARGQGRR